ncbi:hypothetical protein NSPZN2_40168 [Nitrospira defluvii]|uniref:Uracil-DNA glycosylase-like domain-containing protein n=1 Tax=Nitrospira defluvii TaxID=330214 RepID=A0ABM8RS19_9BACT|nr:hypothetical protein NSPZN2_40168 [Nitrospira defluvii]
MRPEVVVCLGRTAAQSLIGGQVPVEQQPGRFFQQPLLVPHSTDLPSLQHSSCP